MVLGNVFAVCVISASVAPLACEVPPSLAHALHSPLSDVRKTIHVIMPIPDNDPRSSKLALPALSTPFPLLQDSSFQMPFQLFQNTSERARKPSRPATASILEGSAAFLLPGPPLRSAQDSEVCVLSPPHTNPQPTPPQPTPLPTDSDTTDYAPRCDAMSGTCSLSRTSTPSDPSRRWLSPHNRSHVL